MYNIIRLAARINYNGTQDNRVIHSKAKDIKFETSKLHRNNIDYTILVYTLRMIEIVIFVNVQANIYDIFDCCR